MAVYCYLSYSLLISTLINVINNSMASFVATEIVLSFARAALALFIASAMLTLFSVIVTIRLIRMTKVYHTFFRAAFMRLNISGNN